MSDNHPPVEDSQIDLPATVAEPGQVGVPPFRPSAISKRQAEAAARALGLSVVKIKRLAASKELGAWVSQLGVVKIGRTMLAMTADQLQETIAQCDKFLAEEGTDPELRAQVIQTKKELLGQYITVANSMIKSAQVDASDGADASLSAMPFMPGQIVIPATNAQVNLGLGPKQGP